MSELFPTQITQGDSILFSQTISNYPSSLYELHYYLNSGAGASVDIEADAVEGGDYLVSIDSETTADWAAGIYRLQKVLVSEEDSLTLGWGSVNVLASLAGIQTATDMRTPTQILLAEVEAAISKILAGGQSYRIHEREFNRANLSELIAWRNQLRNQAARENAAKYGLYNGLGMTLARF